VGVSPSSSDAVALQVRKVVVVMLLVGLTLTESIEGGVFSTVTEKESVLLPPSVSVLATVQVTLSPGEADTGVRLRVVEVPSVVDWVSFVHV